MRGRWWKRSEKHRADKRHVDARALGISYRFARPEEVEASRQHGAPEDPVDAERDRAST